MHRIEVFFREEKNDAESISVKKEIESELGIKTESVKIVHCYYINAELSEEEAKTAAEKLFCDPIVQNYSVDSDSGIKADFMVEIKFLPGVTDNEGNAAMIGVKDLLKREFREKENIRTSKKYFFSGNLKEKEIER
ncbi:phosphoribosylformylglycinamidine synthase subunit PurS, partial [Candidatus Micrarchaeota archaeon]|nr:phosphoribosylformylglycinamidine synthase subunit PurS [Candidatus Micrarchaeota archaeon]